MDHTYNMYIPTILSERNGRYMQEDPTCEHFYLWGPGKFGPYNRDDFIVISVDLIPPTTTSFGTCMYKT